MFALARALLLADAVSHDALAQAMLASGREGESLVRTLMTTGAIDPARLQAHLGPGEVPYMHQIDAVTSLAQTLPEGLCERLLVLPVRRDAMTGTVDVAVVDAQDPHPMQEMAFWLRAPVRMVRTSLGAMLEALRRMTAEPERGMRSLAPPIGASNPGESAPDTLRGRALDPAAGEARVAFIELGARGVPESALVPASEAAPTARGPFPPPGSAGDLAPGADEIRRAEDRDSILESLVAGLVHVVRRVAVFAVRPDAIVGWTCSAGFGNRDALRLIRWPASTRTVLKMALGATGVTLVHLPRDQAHQPLTAALQPSPDREVALAPVRAGGKPVAVVLVAELGDALVATERLQELTRIAGESFERLLRDRRR